MFGLSFLFGGALLALPLAASPVILHLLFRRKSPVVAFSTLRFIRASVQRTASQKRIQQWLLLASRVLLLALLIWAIAQPARRLASRWLSHGSTAVAAIVIDDSYSMLLQQDHTSRLDVANDAVQDLLRNELRDAKVAILRSLPPADGKPEALRSASEILEQWSPLKPSPAPHPLADRVSAAMALLDREEASDKWLVVVTDLQTREFPRPLPSFEGGRFVLLDLHSDDPRSVGITHVAIDPPQPIPGVLSDAVVDIVGKAGDTRACTVSLLGADGQERFKSAPTIANLDNGGRVQLRFPIRLPAERFVQVKAALSGTDDLPWDDSRTLLVGIPPRQLVKIIAPSPATPADRAIALAIDPTEGNDPAWPLDVHRGSLANNDRAAVVVASQWPSESVAHQLAQLVRAGGSVVLCLRPGIEQSWSALPASQQSVLAELLPSPPTVRNVESGTVVVMTDHDPLLNGLTDDKGVFPSAHVRQLIPFVADQTAPLLLGVIGESESGRPQGLLFRKAIGRGVAYTLATWPDSIDSNLATNPAFLPLLVRMCMPPIGSGDASNVGIGQAIGFDAALSLPKTLTLQTPDGGDYAIAGTSSADGLHFRFDRAIEPGLYSWHSAGKTEPVAVANVQLPAAESDLVYRPADQAVPPGANVITAGSLADLRAHTAQLAEPEPHWSGAVAIVLVLICLESLMASTKGLWKPIWPNLFRASASDSVLR